MNQNMKIFLWVVLCLSMCLTHVCTLKTPLMTIQSPDGDIIDCFHLKDQPAFDNPLLEGHDIKDPPVELLKLINISDEKRARQVWSQNGTICPDRTTPIRRSTNGTKHFKGRHWTGVPDKSVPSYTYTADQGHEYAIGELVYLHGIYGAAATMNVWEPFVELWTNEFSLSQIWLVGGHYNESDLNTIEAGWMVYPDHFLDSQPRLFVYWTRDAYQKTGCLNLECAGFVQTSREFAIGGALLPASSYGGSQYDVTFYIWKDTNDGNWWLIMNSAIIGYWPAKLFTHLAHGPAQLVQWGGEIINRRAYNQHTRTQMGSGHFAEEGFGKASFIRNMKIVDYLLYMQPVQAFRILAKTPTCYNVQRGYNEDWGHHFYYGGPGYNSLCP